MRLPIGTKVKVHEHNMPCGGYVSERTGEIDNHVIMKYRSCYSVDGILVDAFYCEEYSIELNRFTEILKEGY